MSLAAHSPTIAPTRPALISTRRSFVPRTERRLVRALHRQDPRAVEMVVRQFGPMLRGYLADALGDRGAAEDVLQQILLDVWRRGPSYDPRRASPATWLLVIARSRAIDHLRRRVPEPYDPTSMAAAADREIEDETSALIERWQLNDLVARLPREERTLLAMRFYDGLSQRQIAERTGIPLGTVKMRMVQALERLRDQLDSQERTP